jgi:hypothetical protein
MSWIPGWDSVTSAHSWGNVYFWASICSLILLGVFEVFSHRYSERKDELAAVEQSDTQRRHDEDMAQLHLQAAQANERAEKLERENIEMREQFAGRRISKEQHDSIVAALIKTPPIRFEIECMNESEAALYAADVVKTLTDAHWIDDGHTFPLGEIWYGLVLFQTNAPGLVELAAAFKLASVPFAIGDEQHIQKDKLIIMVGGKPPPF